MPKTTLIAVHNIKCDGKPVSPGEHFQFEEKDADALVRSGAAKYDRQDISFNLEDVVEAIGQLDPDNKDHYTNDGKPECAAIENVLNELHGTNDADVNAKLRSKAFKKYNEGK